MKSCVLNVRGMSCEHCERAVKEEVYALSGVSNVIVSIHNGTVSVDYNEDIVSVDKIKEAVVEAGYSVV